MKTIVISTTTVTIYSPKKNKTSGRDQQVSSICFLLPRRYRFNPQSKATKEFPFRDSYSRFPSNFANISRVNIAGFPLLSFFPSFVFCFPLFVLFYPLLSFSLIFPLLSFSSFLSFTFLSSPPHSFLLLQRPSTPNRSKNSPI